MTKGRNDPELWSALLGLHDDLLDPAVPEEMIDAELKSLGIDPAAFAKRICQTVDETKEQGRLSWQARAQKQKADLEARISRSASASSTKLMGRDELLARLNELRNGDPSVGGAIQMAARKRKPEESTEQELRVLVAEMEALRAIAEDDSE